MILETQQGLAAAVREAVQSAFGVEIEAVAFQYPPRVELGDLALTAPFDLAKTLRRKPRDIAERLAQELASRPGVRKAEVAGGGYVNLFLDRAPFALPAARGARLGRPGAAAPGPRDRRAHVDQPEQGRAHRPPAQRLPRRHVRAPPPPPRRSTSASRTTSTTPACRSRTSSSASSTSRERRSPTSRAIDGRFDYYCWDLYARVGDFYAADPARKKLQAEALHAIEEGGNDTARLAAHVAARIVDCHLATMERLGIRYDLLAHESDILRLHFWDRAFELLKESGAIRLETEGKNAGCWVLPMGEGDAAAIDEDKIIVRSNGTVTYTGKDIAYQLWKLGRLDRDFRYRRHRTRPRRPRRCGRRRAARARRARRPSATRTPSTTSSTSASRTRSAW